MTKVLSTDSANALAVSSPFDQSRIIVPTVFREDYILALRKRIRRKDPLAYINEMTQLHQFSDNLYGIDFTELKNHLAACNAYEEPSQAKLQIIAREVGL